MRQLSACLFFALLTSCAAKKGPDTKLDDVPGFCSEWATNACNDTIVKDCGTTTAACVQAQQTFCESIVPGAKYSSDFAPDCLKAVGEAYKDGQLTADERNTVLRIGNDCAKLLSGPGVAGATCATDSDCVRSEGLSCVAKSDAPAAGKCEVPVEVSAGLDCSAPASVCTTGFYCNGANCIGGKVPGNTCSASVPCSTDSHCVIGATASVDAGADATAPAAAGAGTGTCVAKVATGACATDDDCTSGICSVPAGTTAGRCGTVTVIAGTDELCVNLGAPQ